MKIKEWIQKIQEKVNLRREETEVRDNKDYAITFAILGLITGMVVCTFIVIFQLFVSNLKTQNVLMQIVMNSGSIGLLAYVVWMLLPMFKSERTVVDKVLTTLLALACAFVPYIVGIYLAMLFFIGLVVLFALWFAGKLLGWWVEDNARATSQAPRPSPGPEKFELSDGTVVTDTGFGSYSGSDGHSYERGYGDERDGDRRAL